jgi:hypothetical protein
MKQDDTLADDDRTGEPGAHVSLPQAGGTAGRPAFGKRRAGVGPVPPGSKKLRPVLGHQRAARGEDHEEQDERAQAVVCHHYQVGTGQNPAIRATSSDYSVWARTSRSTC